MTDATPRDELREDIQTAHRAATEVKSQVQIHATIKLVNNPKQALAAGVGRLFTDGF